MMDPQVLARIAARRAELDGLEEYPQAPPWTAPGAADPMTP
ncbi:hypothetical protein ABIA32_005344 [Streptacidiphilus sp. MAP12-20]